MLYLVVLFAALVLAAKRPREEEGDGRAWKKAKTGSAPATRATNPAPATTTLLGPSFVDSSGLQHPNYPLLAAVKHAEPVRRPPKQDWPFSTVPISTAWLTPVVDTANWHAFSDDSSYFAGCNVAGIKIGLTGTSCPRVSGEDRAQVLASVGFNALYQFGWTPFVDRPTSTSNMARSVTILTSPEGPLRLTAFPQHDGTLYTLPVGARGQLNVETYMATRLDPAKIRDFVLLGLAGRTLIVHDGLYDLLHLLKWLSTPEQWLYLLTEFVKPHRRVSQLLLQGLKAVGIAGYVDVKLVWYKHRHIIQNVIKLDVNLPFTVENLANAVVDSPLDQQSLRSAGYQSLAAVAIYHALRQQIPNLLDSTMNECYLPHSLH